LRAAVPYHSSGGRRLDAGRHQNTPTTPNTHNYVCGHNLKGITEDNIAWNAEDPTLKGEWDGMFVEYGHTWRAKGFDGIPRTS